jgi:hypothetical protein
MNSSERLTVGARIPDLPLLDAHGVRTGLRSFEGEATALIFLRHLG